METGTTGRREKGIAVIADPQSKANLLRALLSRDPAVKETGVEVRLVQGTAERLRVLLDHEGRELVFERGGDWTGAPLGRTKELLKEALLAELGHGS